MQMLGRAGRPGHEHEACAVILCLNDRLQKYKKMVAGEEVIESSLHQNLIEHLNAEISIGTINSISSAKQWLSSTFLNVRLQRNPRYYDIDSSEASDSADDLLQGWCERDIRLLLEANLIEDNGMLHCTDCGDAMARYCVKFETMKAFMAVPVKAKVSEVLLALSQAVEFRNYRLKQGEKSFYKSINQANEIRYPVNVDIAQTQHKVSLILQARLGCMLTGKDNQKISPTQVRQFNMDTNGVVSHAKRLIRCLVDVLVQRGDSFAVKSSLELARSIAAGVWDGTVMQLKQIPGVGDVYMRKLAAANIKSIDTLNNTEASRIEVVLSKKPGFGNELLKKAAEFPMLQITVHEVDRQHKSPKGAEIKIRCQVGFLNKAVPMRFNQRQYSVLFLCETSCGELVDFRRFGPSRLRNAEPIFLTALLKQLGTGIRCHVMCDDLAGTNRSAELQVNCDKSWFPAAPPTPEVTFHRPTLATKPSVKQAPDDFEDELDDLDLLAIVQKHCLDEVIDDIDAIMAHDGDNHQQRARRKRNLSISDQGEQHYQEPQKLPNGNWICQHACADEGKECKHKCCTEGVKKKPTRKRTRKNDKKDVDEDKGQSKQAKKTAAQKVTQIGPLDKMLSKDRDPSINGQDLEILRKQSYLLQGQPRSNESQASITSTGTSQSKQIRNLPDPLPLISDTFGSGDFDWQVIDHIAAEHEDNALENAVLTKKGYEIDPRGQAVSDRVTWSNNASSYCGPHESYGPDLSGQGLFCTQSSSPNKQENASCHYNGDHSIPSNDCLERSDFSTTVDKLGAQSTRSSTSTINASSTSSCSFNDDKNSLFKPATHSNEASLPEVECEPEEEREKRLYEEDQKRRWDEIGSTMFTYESHGSWLKIVDDSK